MHQDVNKQEARQRVIELLRMVGIPEQKEPPFKDYGKEHFAACWLLETGTKGASKLTLDKISSENTSAIGAVKNG